MTRKELFKKIAEKLEAEDLIRTEDFMSYEDAIHATALCLEEALDSYAIVEGTCNVLGWK